MAPPTHTQLHETNIQSGSQLSSPNASSSDKENSRRRANKRNMTAMPSSRPQSKRQRLTDRNPNSQSGQSYNDTRYYDPDQDPEERRIVRKGLRDLGRELNDTRGELMQPGNDGIFSIVEQANQFYENVKQTSDATLDSRLLVNAADLSHKKATQLALGETTAGIDVDEFVSKCISFMRRGPNNATSSANGTQGRRGRFSRSQRDPEASDDDDSGDAMNWDTLGRLACAPYNARPAVSGWLLGPLSLQKRTRQVSQRRAREEIDPRLAVGPSELAQKDLGGQENANLTTICSEINKLLARTQVQGLEKAEAALRRLGNPTPEQAQDIMAAHNVADDGGVPLFRFCINRRSFGQSVENLFYVSFLVRDGTIGVDTDSRGLPTLHAAEPFAPNEAQRKGLQKHQSVFSLDHETWSDICETFELEDSIISHREEVEGETSTSWYS
ncbi:uncharacterized protein N7515_000649 [Penicillium bovifimosum]|uniref:Non-structural maintenance of chromosomes element 4 n=1 Tax=Penicillium bovifimosum TaxID=126998 RepID=A0A9W9HHS7_9EURO|nr:uncharacterized protein N7515_000649 [Penicillium bovifimosum]KAJ5146085.1 hypothetical protein N7515_000649 [Penicillium bovifimosum]